MSQQTNHSPVLCSSGCGFFGSPSNNGMCSMCYRDSCQRQNSNRQPASPGSTSNERGSHANRTTVTEATSPAHTQPGPGSGATALSTEDSTSGTKTGLPAERSQTRAASRSEQDGRCSAGSSGTVLSSSPSTKGKKRKRKDQRKDGENTDFNRASSSKESPVPPVQTEEKPKAKKIRCFTCNKKVGLTGFDCRCGNVFCGLHRYSDIHNCTFDYRAEAAERIRKENPVVVGEKIKKI